MAGSLGGAGSASVRVMAGTLAGACSSCVTERPRALRSSGPLAAHIWKNSCSAGQAAWALVSTQRCGAAAARLQPLLTFAQAKDMKDSSLAG